MSMQKDIATLRLLGGHPALDFVNTVYAWRDGWGPDFLIGYGDLLDWAGRAGLVAPGHAKALQAKAAAEPQAAEVALGRVRTLRQALHGLFLCESGSPPAAGDIDHLNAVLSEAGQYREVRRKDGSFGWAWREEANLDTVLHRVAVAAADLLAERQGRRAVRECPGENCGWLFLDTSRGGRRRWCSEETCGTAMRVRRFRRKERTGRG